MEYATHTPSNRTGAYFYDARNAVGAAVSEVIQSGLDIDTALANAQAEADFAMAE